MKPKLVKLVLQTMADISSYVPLFETKKAKGSFLYKPFAVSVLLGIVQIWIYRVTHIPENGWAVWMGLFGAELWFGFYWVLTQAHRWSQVYRYTFKDRLSQRYGDDLPGIDVFVCTADPKSEPPVMVINTVLSVMAYDYPPEKLSVYLSDDAGSDLTFYALLECSHFAKHWIPYCKKYDIEPRAPEAYFRTGPQNLDPLHAQHLASIQKLYQEMENRIELATKLDRVSMNASIQHKGFSKWDTFSSRKDHDTILQILIDGNDTEARDIQGCVLPTLVYLAREKRPEYFHNYKAGAMNALIRVSSEISNGPIILNVDCDMYSNNSVSIRDALCFFLDEKKGNEIAFVQFPQSFHNLTRNDLYGNALRAVYEVEFCGLDASGGPMYIGTGCFHRRDVLSGRKFSRGSTFEWKNIAVSRNEKSSSELEEQLKEVASCRYEENTQWGNEIGLKYGCLVEDVATGLSIHSQGWKSIYFNPKRKGFLGFAGTTLDQNLVQHKRWSEGNLQLFLSKDGHIGKGLWHINVALLAGCSVYGLWAPNCFATVFYSIIPSLYMLKGLHLFPQVSSLWIYPFVYVAISANVYSFVEFLSCGGTVSGWWNEQRMWLYKRTSSYLFAVVDTFLKLFGFSESGFVISAKVLDDELMNRYEQEIMEFGVDSPMVTLLSSIAMINLFCLAALVVGVIRSKVFEISMIFQMVCCGVIVLINFPLYSAAFFRRDPGRLPSSVTIKSASTALCICAIFAMY